MPHFAFQAATGASRDAGSGAKGLGKALATRVTFFSALGQPLCHPSFSLFFFPNRCVGAIPPWLSSEDAGPQHAKPRICYPLHSHCSLPPESGQAGKGQPYNPHSSLDQYLRRVLQSKKAALHTASQPSCMPTLQGRPKFWLPSPKAGRWVLCVQTGVPYGCAEMLPAWGTSLFGMVGASLDAEMSLLPPGKGHLPAHPRLAAQLPLRLPLSGAIGARAPSSLPGPPSPGRPRLPASKTEQGPCASGCAASYFSLPFKSSLHWVKALSAEVINPERISLSITPGAS